MLSGVMAAHAVRPQNAAVRAYRLEGARGISATLSHYSPLTRLSAHEHGFTQISFLLAGEMRESLGRNDFDLGGPSHGCKPAGHSHSNEYGKPGALIFAVNLGDEGEERAVRQASGWGSTAAGKDVPSLVRVVLEAADPSLRAELLWDLVALEREEEHPRRSPPPVWLEQIRGEIRDAPDLMRIDAASQTAGVHRTRISRLFRRHYGVPPSVYRLRCMAAKGIAFALASEGKLVEAAYDVGFSDQSHLARTVKACTGLPLQRLKSLLG